MKHFIIFIILIFGGLFSALVIRKNRNQDQDSRAVLRIYAHSSFVKQWGPGPWLKEKFESYCGCRVEYHESADTISLIQRIKSEPQSRAADLVFGFDQYDLEAAQRGVEWKNIKISNQNFVPEVKSLLTGTNFIPYDWGVLGFVGRQNEIAKAPTQIDDLLLEEFADQISIQDPRTSTPGLQFLLWLVQVKGEEQAFQFLQKLNKQVKSWGASWSMTYGLFQKGQVKLTYSYATSPIASLKEDSNSQVVIFPFREGHSIQYEFMGIPSSCQNCELSEKFVNLVLSKEGQKIIMDKNYMFPVIEGIKEGTLFESALNLKTIDMTVIPSVSERERLLKKWSAMRRME